jgi:hypothetical protein
MPNRIQVGANLVCIINGQKWGAVTGLQYTLSPTVVGVQGTIQLLMQRNDEGLEGRQVTAGLPYISAEHYFSIMLQDRQSAFIEMRIDNASVEQQTWNPVAKGMVQGQFSFKGLMAKNHYNQ